MPGVQTFFFFQEEDGIRDLTVTGVQTCALPISRRRPIQSVGGRALATAAGWLLALLLLLPHLTLGLVSLVPYGTWTTEAVPPVLSVVNYQRLFGEPERLRPLVNSLWMAAASTAAAVALALVAGALVGRRRPGRIP